MRLRAVLVVALTAIPFSSSAQDLPAKGWLVWSSQRDNRQEIYLKHVEDDGALQRLTDKGGQYPMWSPKGQWIAYFSLENGYAYVMRPDGSDKRKLCDSGKLDWTGGGLFWLYDSGEVVCVEGEKYYAYDLDTSQRRLVFDVASSAPLASASFEAGSISRDGQWIAGTTSLFRNGYKAENGTFKAYWSAAFLRISEPAKIFYFGRGCEPTFSPTEDRMFHVCAEECPHPTDIVSMKIADRMSRSSYEPEVSYPDEEWGHEYYPRISNDGQWLAYAGATAHSGPYNIYLHKLGSGTKARIQVTNHKATDNFPHLFVGDPWPATTPSPDAGAPTPDGGESKDGSSSTVDGGAPLTDGPVLPSGDARKGQRAALGGGCRLAGRPSLLPLLLLLALAVRRR